MSIDRIQENLRSQVLVHKTCIMERIRMPIEKQVREQASSQIKERCREDVRKQVWAVWYLVLDQLKKK